MNGQAGRGERQLLGLLKTRYSGKTIVTRNL